MEIKPTQEAELTCRLPPWDRIKEAGEVYLLYCDCQPFPLFHRRTFLQTLRSRDPELLLAILSLCLRFSDHSFFQERQTELIEEYLEASRTAVMKKVSDGTVELSTIQSLCLLSLVDFSSQFFRPFKTQAKLSNDTNQQTVTRVVRAFTVVWR